MCVGMILAWPCNVHANVLWHIALPPMPVEHLVRSNTQTEGIWRWAGMGGDVDSSSQQPTHFH